MTGSYDPRIRLGEIIGDARNLVKAGRHYMPAEAAFRDDRLGERGEWAKYCGQLEAMITMLANEAEIVAQARFP